MYKSRVGFKPEDERQQLAAENETGNAGAGRANAAQIRAGGGGNAAKVANSSETPKKAAAPRAGGQQPAGRPAAPRVAPPPPEPQVIEVRPMAEQAKMRPRHWGMLASFLIVVLIPIALIGWYLWDRAVDQYASSTGFTVRSEEGAASTALLGGFSQLIGGSGSTGVDSNVIFEFIQGQDIATRIDERLNLRAHYTANAKQDPIFSLKPGSTIEDLRDYWRRVVRVAYDSGTGLVNIQVRAFDPEMAQQIAEEILAESQRLVNELNATARTDALKYAQEDLDESVARLKAAREALVDFRIRTQIVDPESDLQGRMGVLNGLQAQLAQALIDYDLQVQQAAPSDPRITQLSQRIEVIRERISEEKANFASSNSVDGLEAYPELLAEYEGLIVDREFTEQTYRAALASLDAARSAVARQSRYLAIYLHPTLSEQPEYPRRWIIFGISALFLFLFWSILSLSFYALRDRR